MILIKKLTNTTWKKCLWIFIVVFIIMLLGSGIAINYLNDVVNDNNIHDEEIIVKDKIYGDSAYTDYCIIIGTNNKTYRIVNHNDNYGKKMFESIEIGKKYRMIVKEPELTDLHKATHILQVHNETS